MRGPRLPAGGVPAAAAAEPEPTAAPVRSRLVGAGRTARHHRRAACRLDGRPFFTVTIGKSRTAWPGQFTLEWNPDEPHLTKDGATKRRAKKDNGQRILSLVVSLLAAERILRGTSGAVWRSRPSDHPTPSHPPLVISHRQGNAQAHFGPRRSGRGVAT